MSSRSTIRLEDVSTTQLNEVLERIEGEQEGFENIVLEAGDETWIVRVGKATGL